MPSDAVKPASSDVGNIGAVRWETLFADLEARFEASGTAELDAEVAERVRTETGALALVDRLRGHTGRVLTLRLVTGTAVRGHVLDVAADACVLGEETGSRVLLPVGAVATVSALGRPARVETSPVLRRLGLRHALRGLARERAQVRVSTLVGELRGTVDRVGSDHVDLGDRGTGEAAGASTTVALAALVALRPD